MTLNEFVAKWTGKKCDFDGFYGGQCQDLYRQYVQEVLEFPQSPGVVGAKDNWDVYLTEYYDRIPNTPDGVPEPGDIMIWGSKYGQYGHVAVVVSANKSSFTCFSQNDPTGTLCGLKKYTAWGSTLGWLHPKQKDSMYEGLDLNNNESMKACVDVWKKLQEGKLISQEDHQRIINELDSKSTEQAKQYAKEKQILEEKIRVQDEALLNLQTTEHSWETEADKYQRLFRVVVNFLSDNDIQITSESTEDEIKGALSTATRSEEIANLYAEIQTRLILTEMSPEGFLKALEGLESGYKNQIETVTKELSAKIEALKNKQPSLWQFIINKYFK